MSADLTGLPAGAHAFHVHQSGDCSAPDASSAGGHCPFEAVGEDATPDFITGSLGEIHAADEGAGFKPREIPTAMLNGPRAIQGRAVVVHQKSHDPAAAPTGDTGPRIACGVIGVVGD